MHGKQQAKKLTYLITYTAIMLVDNWKITQDLIPGSDVVTHPLSLKPHQVLPGAIVPPLPSHADRSIGWQRTQALHPSSLPTSNTRETTQAKPSFKFIHLTLKTRTKASTLLVFIYKASRMDRFMKELAESKRKTQRACRARTGQCSQWKGYRQECLKPDGTFFSQIFHKISVISSL